MGGFTLVYLKDKSKENISYHNDLLKQYGVPRRYRFNNLEKDQKQQYGYYLSGKYDSYFPEHLFPSEKIHNFEDFQKYWNPEALGEIFVHPNGSLGFDCYFGRTSNRAMRNIGKYIANYIDCFEKFDGSFETFMERGMTRRERKIVKESGVEY